MINATILLSIINIAASTYLVSMSINKIRQITCNHLIQIVNIVPLLGVAAAGINVVFMVYIQTDSATITAVQVWMLLMVLSMGRLVSIAK